MLAITNGTVIDGRGSDPLEGAVVLIEGERITAVGKRAHVNIPRDATVIDAAGGSILPGLIDTHVHFMLEYPDVLRSLLTPPSLRLLQAIPRMRATLEAGITTVRDAGGTPAGLKMAVERGIIAGPRMQVAVTLISQTGGHGDGYYPCCVDIGLFGIRFYDVPDGVVDGVEEVRKKTREILRAGADWIKLATSGGVLSAAEEKRCMAHAQGTMGIQNALVAGVASIEHGIYLTDELIELMIERNVYLVPTLVAPRAVIQFSQEHPELLPPAMAAKAHGVVEAHTQSFRWAVKAGVKVAMGTDAGVGRHGDNGQELVLMVENGMTPVQAIVASTSHAAQLLNMDQNQGTLEEGKIDDVIIVDGDILNNIGKIADPANVKLVLKGGQAAKNMLAVTVPMLAGLM